MTPIRTSRQPFVGRVTDRPRTTIRKATNPAPRLVLDSNLFRGVLFRERKRADRFNQPVALLLVTINAPSGAGSLAVWNSAVAALSAATRDSDVIGWFEPRGVLGVVLPEISGTAHMFPRGLETRVRRELARRLDSRNLGRVAISLHVYSHPLFSEELWPEERAVKNGQAADTRKTAFDIVKRTIDIAGSAVLLTVLSPLLLTVAALIKLKSPGPVLFRQTRIGHRARSFTLFKFRTMVADADHALHHEFVTKFITAGGSADAAQDGTLFKITNDPRVTPLGAILRKTSIDELPQLWNVLVGDMSLVGPRPPLPYEIEKYKPWHWARVMQVKPGVTGLWQVAGRSRTTFDGMVRLDLRYARTCSLWMDIKILLATPAAVISGKGAC